MISVKATREGLAGKQTASGYIIDSIIPFVALPSTKALHKFVRVMNPLTRIECIAIVLDVGPWNVDDDEYVFQHRTEAFVPQPSDVPIRPAAESGKSISGKGTNDAGIDLSERVWNTLQMEDNGMVEWEFVE